MIFVHSLEWKTGRWPRINLNTAILGKKKTFISRLFNKLVIIKINERSKNADGNANAACNVFSYDGKFSCVMPICRHVRF